MAHVDRDRLAYFLSKLQSWVASYAPSKAVATSYSPGLMSAADKAKLDGLQIDAALNAASVNPVQNRALAQALQALDGRVGDLESAGSTTYTYKGSVPTYADLPSSGNQPGDVYDVLTSPDDGSWAWDGDSWNKLSGFVDLSALATKDVATPTSDGLMSAADKASLDALLQGFVPLWSSAPDYSAGMLVRGSDGALYLSKQASGPGTAAFAQNPVNDSAGTYWGRIPSDAADLLHLSGAETVTGQKTFTQPIVGDVTGSASHAGTADSASYADASGGAAAWSALKDYAKGSLALGSDGKIYYAASASGPGEGGAYDPVSDGGTFWTPLSTDDGDLFHLSGAETVTGAKTFSQPISGDVSVAAAGSGTSGRLLSDRAADVVNVKDYGAKGDGSTDDTAAFLAAAAAAGGAPVFVPDGDYVLSDSVAGRFFGTSSAKVSKPLDMVLVDERPPRGGLMEGQGTHLFELPYDSDDTVDWGRAIQGFAYDRYDDILYCSAAYNHQGELLYAYNYSTKMLLGTNYNVGAAQRGAFYDRFAHQNLALYRPSASDEPLFFSSGPRYTAPNVENPDNGAKLRLLRWDWRSPTVCTIVREWTMCDVSAYYAGNPTVCISDDGTRLCALFKRLSDGIYVLAVWNVSDVLSAASGSNIYSRAVVFDSPFDGTAINGQGMACDGRFVYCLYSGSSSWTPHHIFAIDILTGWKGFYRGASWEGFELPVTGRTVSEGEAINFLPVGGRMRLCLATCVVGTSYKRPNFYDLETPSAPLDRASTIRRSGSGTSADFNLLAEGLSYYCTSGTMSDFSNGAWSIIVLHGSESGYSKRQIAWRINTTNEIYTRLIEGTSAGPWRKFLFSIDYGIEGSRVPAFRINDNHALFARVVANRDTVDESCFYIQRYRRETNQGATGNSVVYLGIQENTDWFARIAFSSYWTVTGNNVLLNTYLTSIPDFPSDGKSYTAVSNLGSSDQHWDNSYIDTNALASSDVRLKDNIAPVSEALMRAWGRVNFKVFQMKNALARKGPDARMHVGVVAQEVEAAFAAEGLDASRYGLFGYDRWEDLYDTVEVVDVPAVLDEDGRELAPAVKHTERVLVRPGGDVYSIRYAEALALECAYQRWLGAKRDEEIAALKARLGA